RQGGGGRVAEQDARQGAGGGDLADLVQRGVPVVHAGNAQVRPGSAGFAGGGVHDDRVDVRPVEDDRRVVRVQRNDLDLLGEQRGRAPAEDARDDRAVAG